jgi:hypothetical protein
MDSRASSAPNAQCPGELDALLAAIAEAIEALTAWNIPGFESAVERQREICERLGCQTEWRKLPRTATTASKVKELNRSYDRLLQHSIHWTRTIQSILRAGGHSLPGRGSVHFRG